MKNTILFLALLVVPVGAASYTITNNKGPVNTSSIVDNAGNFLTAGTARVGYFTVDDAQIQGAGSNSFLTSNFVTFTSAADGVASVSTTTGIQGVFSTQGTGVDLTNASSEFRTKSVYLLVTNASQDQALVFKFGQTFGTAEVNATLFLEGAQSAGAGNDSPTGGTLLLGGYDVFLAEPHTTVSSGDVNPAFNLVQVPEPSSTALLGFGAVALLLRRRR